MYTLFISTFDKNITIGILKNGFLLDKIEKDSKQNHSELVMPMISEILNKNKINIKQINNLVVVNGPGSFTGVRIGITIAKTLAYVLNIPIKTITSLEAFAVSNETDSDKIILISDLKGKYIGYFDKDNGIKQDFIYLKNNEYQSFINGKEEFVIENNSLDLEKIYVYLKDKDSINPHVVNPIYIKNIEVLSDK